MFRQGVLSRFRADRPFFERQVLALVAGGFTNREIGEKLGIATGTAKAHVERVIGKLGVADRTQAAVQGIALGLVAPTERQP